MADLSFNVGESLASGAKGMQDFLETSAAPSILKQAYAGATPEQMADPMQRKAVYEQAAMLAGQKGMNALSYNFQKQASELTADAQKQQLDNIKIKQGEVAYANQLIEGATDDAGLQSAVASTVKDPAARMQVESILRNPNMDFVSKKAMLSKMTMTAKERLDAIQLQISGQDLEEKIRRNKALESDADKTQALARDQETRLSRDQFQKIQETEKARYNTLIKTLTDQGILPNSQQFPQYLRDYLKTGQTKAEREQGAVSPSGERASAAPTTDTATGDKRPLSQRYNNPGNITDSSGKIRKFDSLAEGEAALDKEIGTKLSGNSAAYKRQFKDLPITPARFAQVWSPADAPGNSAESTGNYAKYIAAKLGIPANQKIEDTPENREKIKQAVTEFEAGPGSGKQRAAAPTAAAATAEDPMFREPSTSEMYDTKRGGGLTLKEWSTINPTAGQIGKEYKINPMALTSATTEEKKQTGTSYQVTKLAENTAEYIKEHQNAVGTLAAVTQAALKKGGNILDNVRADKRYTGDVAEMGKRLFALGLKDAGSAGRLNVYLEKQFADFYEQSKSPESLLRIIKARQDESFENLNSVYGADKNNLDKSKYKLAFADDAYSYLGEGKKGAGGSAAGNRPSLDSFDRSRSQVPAGMPTR
jgi:hypothetical protein